MPGRLPMHPHQTPIKVNFLISSTLREPARPRIELVAIQSTEKSTAAKPPASNLAVRDAGFHLRHVVSFVEQRTKYRTGEGAGSENCRSPWPYSPGRTVWSNVYRLRTLMGPHIRSTC